MSLVEVILCKFLPHIEEETSTFVNKCYNKKNYDDSNKIGLGIVDVNTFRI
jgi:hypothetical protein